MNDYKFTKNSRQRMRSSTAAEREQQRQEDKKAEEFFSDVKPEKQQINVTVNIDAVKQVKDLYRKLQPGVVQLKSKIPGLKISKKFLQAGLAIALLGIGIGGVSSLTSDNNQGENDTPSVQGVAVIQEPDFDFALPEQDVSPAYDTSTNSVNYETTIDTVKAVVSQQPIPENELDNEFFTLKVAQAFNINKEFPSDSGGVFIGENREQQVQTAILKYEDNLVFIRVSKIIQNDKIIDFINKLQI